MKIVVLDGYALNPGDLSWEALEALGDCTVYDRTTPQQTVDRAASAEILLTNKTVLTADMLEQLGDCKYIGVLATGFNIVDTAAASEKNIIVANVPTYSTLSVAQMVFAHVLNLTQHVGDHSRTAREGKWTASPDFCYWDYPLIELAGKTMGIIGLGRIGQATAKLAAAFGMNVIAYTRNPEACIAAGVSPATLDELLASSDVVSLHCPLTDETQGMINAARLAKMKPSAFLINTSRGPLIDQQALADALNEGRLAGAGLDVMCAEPPPADNPLLSAKNCCITPHIAWATKEARQRLMATTIENIKAFQNAAPQNVVNAR